MSTSIVLQLQQIASDSTHDIGDVLRKALLVARKLQLDESVSWIKCELEGYAKDDAIPQYRVLRGDLRAMNPYNGLIPCFTDNAEKANRLKTRPIREPISSISQTLSEESQIAVYSFDSVTEQSLMDCMPVPLKPVVVIGKNQFAGIIGAVRTRVLEWALRLESEGVVGEGLSFSEQERVIANSHQINIENFQGVLGDVTHGGKVKQQNTMHIAKGDWSELARALAEIGVARPDVDALEIAISKDPTPAGNGRFGPLVSKWVGRMLTKAADGTWDIGIGAAGGLLAAAIGTYYGAS